ncbi:MAG: DNA polymerase III subunit alpha [Prevotellaceae bacterium]|nr:DNA polymerase III subunit alpha [Candidatus Colivivens caballi]
MQDFIHLHVHTQYSILDGQASVQKLVDKAINDGQRGLAITDHGNMFGIKEFFNYYNKLKGKNPDLDFKPIFGCEVYCARRGRHIKEEKIDSSGWHLILLAKNEKGYHNLVKLVSHAWTEGFYSRPRTDHSEIEKYHEGIICCSACIGGEVPYYILRDQNDKAEEAVKWFKGIFGDDYYLELQRHEVKNPMQKANRETFPLQQKANEVIIELARKYNIKLVCTNDVHFVDEDNAEAHDRLLCVSTGKDLDDPSRMLYSKQEWMKTREEMNAVFADIPEALTNTLEILDKVETYTIDHSPIMPNFDIPKEFGTEEEYRQRITEQELFDEFTRDENGNVIMSEEDGLKKISKMGGYDKLYRIKFEADYLEKLTFEGAKKYYGDPVPEDVVKQLKFELHVMKTMGFPGYFLIVQDYIRAAREKLGVWVGPGRGSAAGSAVAYCLEITKVDPIKYDLLFERFLNPDRISLPDIDVDFDDDGRGKVLRWITEKYGAEKVAHIITYGTMATKLAIKDVARVQKIPLATVDAICKAIPDKLPDDENGKPRKMNLKNAIACVPELKDASTSPDDSLRTTIRYAQMLENNVRNTGVHACGTIICRDDITDWVPVSTAEDKDTHEKVNCTQYDGHVIEETGLIKMDFLGLKTLSQLKEAVNNIRESLGIELDVDFINIEDPSTYQLYCDGRTIGTFQFESPGMQKYLRELQPHAFEDLIAMNALYRPGPMDYIPDFIDRKLGRQPIKYDIDVMERYLKDTYGITVYQEQVMLLSRLLANFTRGESDTLRKAMGKKQKDKLDKLHPKFLEGGKKNGHDEAVLEKIWADWEKFASYAFNKSHATCYSWVAFQTAYVKANYPAQWMAAVMSRSLADIKEITKLMDECKSIGINTLGPDINESNLKFSVNHYGDIRFGMAAIKGVGGGAVETIITERKKNGDYKDIFDLVERVNLTSCNRKNLECLALAGAFDSFGLPRETYFAPTGPNETFLDVLVRYGNRYQADKAEAQGGLFGAMEISTVHPELPKDVELWGNMDRLNRERNLVGIYLSAHPLDDYEVILKYVCNTRVKQLDDLESLASISQITFGGMVNEVKSSITKKGNPCGFVTLEDYSGSYRLAIFGKQWQELQNSFTVNTCVFVKARVESYKYNSARKDLAIQSVELMPEVKDTLVKHLSIIINYNFFDSEMSDDLIELIHRHPGSTPIVLKFALPDGRTLPLRSRTIHIEPHRSMFDYVEARSDYMKIAVND